MRILIMLASSFQSKSVFQRRKNLFCVTVLFFVNTHEEIFHIDYNTKKSVQFFFLDSLVQQGVNLAANSGHSSPAGVKHEQREHDHRSCRGLMGLKWVWVRLALAGWLEGWGSSTRCTYTRDPPCSSSRSPASPTSCQRATRGPPASSAGSSASCSGAACSRPPDSHLESRSSPSWWTLK